MRIISNGLKVQACQETDASCEFAWPWCAKDCIESWTGGVWDWYRLTHVTSWSFEADLLRRCYSAELRMMKKAKFLINTVNERVSGMIPQLEIVLLNNMVTVVLEENLNLDIPYYFFVWQHIWRLNVGAIITRTAGEDPLHELCPTAQPCSKRYQLIGLTINFKSLLRISDIRLSEFGIFEVAVSEIVIFDIRYIGSFISDIRISYFWYPNRISHIHISYHWYPQKFLVCEITTVRI